jgi:predicted nicotinamide N-methyase
MSNDYHFETIVKELNLGGEKVLLKTVVQPESLFDQLLAKGKDHPDVKAENMPYWAELWPSSIALGNFLLENRYIVNGKKVLEIGCGLGLAGICANLAGAEVLLTDYLDDALELASESWVLNFNSAAPVMNLDWMYPPDHAQFEVVIAADVLYEKKNHAPLFDFLLKILPINGKIIFTDPQRSATTFFFSETFLEEFEYKKTSLEYQNLETNHSIDIYICNRRNCYSLE